MTHPSLRAAAAILTAAVLVILPHATSADATSQNDLRRAVERGEIRPLSQILESLRGKVPGEVVRVEVERRKGRWLYEFRVIGPNGRLLEVHVDASSGEIERQKEK